MRRARHSHDISQLEKSSVSAGPQGAPGPWKQIGFDDLKDGNGLVLGSAGQLASSDVDKQARDKSLSSQGWKDRIDGYGQAVMNVPKLLPSLPEGMNRGRISVPDDVLLNESLEQRELESR